MIGQRLGPYEVTAKLGEGGMGEVYRATDSNLRREVAIKVLPAAFTADKDRLARFEREAQLLAQLHHPHIASIFGLETSGGARALVMELVEGPTLQEKLGKEGLPVDEAVAIAKQIAEALEAAHDKGIVHRDLKPANVKLAPDGNVKVLDFGLAKALEPAGAGSGSPGASPTLMHSPTLTAAGTQLGVILGTAAYMAPEQARGGAVDKRADIWAFGVVLYEMLAGRSLFASDTVSDTLAGVLKTEIDFTALPQALPPELRRLLRRCLERNPKNRLHDIADARLVLDDLIAGRAEAPGTPVAVPAAPDPRAGQRGRLLQAGAGALAVAMAFGGYGLGRRATSGTGAKSMAPVATRFQQITDAPGVESAPSLSPDGKDVVFTRMVDGQSEVVLQRIGARTSTPLSSGPEFDDRQPAFSPDGERIAFRSERDGGGIFVMDTSGESLRRISDFGFYPTWSPDGREIAVALGDFYFPTDRGGTVRGLFAIDVASGERREVSRTGDTMQPRWSPHGQRIAFWGLKEHTGQRDLRTIAADGSEADTNGKAVTDDPALDWSPEWSPDGRFLYFASRRGGTMNLWRIAIEEADGVVRGVPEPVTAPSLWVGGLSFSRDGRRLAYASLDWRTSLLRAEFDAARGQLAGPPTPMLQGTQPIRDHQLSPDGGSVVFMRTTDQEDLFVARIDGSQSRRLTDDAARDRGPTWSPDGRRISFYSDRSGSYQIWTIHPDGSGLVQLTDIKEGTTNFPTWSPDGSQLATSIIPGGAHLLSSTETTSTRSPQAIPPFAEHVNFWPFSWSRDGRHLLGTLVLESGGIDGVASYDLEARTYERVTTRAGRQWLFPIWLSDSRRIILRDARGIWLLDPGRAEPRRLVRVGGYAIGASVGISRDDRWLTWSETGTEGDVWLAELAELK